MNENLQLGSTGDKVKILQEKLKILGYYNAVITGSFGITTEIGVKAFQKKENLKETGIVDNTTWNLLNNYTEPNLRASSTYPQLSFGATGSFVKDLQIKLKALLYYSGEINSNFDLETENAVKRFQLNNELTASGIVNNETWSLLNYLYGNLNVCALENNTENNNQDDEVYDTYKVQKNDTLYAIARKFNTTVDDIKSLNNLTSNTLAIGQVLKIPSSNSNSSSNNYLNYTVLKNDTLYAIARKFNTTVDDIKSLNNLTSNTLAIGQVLKIPSSNSNSSSNNYINYTVLKNDTLYAIARKFNTTVDDIKSLNNLTSNTLAIGQVLKIPN